MNLFFLIFLIYLLSLTSSQEVSNQDNDYELPIWATAVPPRGRKLTIETLNNLFSNTTEPSIQRYLKARDSLVEGVKNYNQEWKKYENVNGVHNKRVVMLVSSTIVNPHFMWERIIPASRTWMKGFANVIVLLEDSFIARFSLRHCEMKEYRKNTVFSCPNEPLYLLSRECTAEYYGGPGPCCKVDELFNFIVNDYDGFIDNIDYIFHGDDDTYYRPDQILRYVGAIEKSGINHLPIVGNAEPDHDYTKVGGVWHINGCTDISNTAWFQPAFVNKAAIKKMSVAFASYGVRDICIDWVVTHDVGLQPFFWLYSPYHTQLPKTFINPMHKGTSIFEPQMMIVHYMKPHVKDLCRGEDVRKWDEKYRFKNNIMLGCGDVNESLPQHDTNLNANFYDAYNYFNQHGQDVEIPLVTRYATMKDNVIESVSYNPFPGAVEVKIPGLSLMGGYEKTNHAKKYNIQTKWVSFKPSDCSVPGRVN